MYKLDKRFTEISDGVFCMTQYTYDITVDTNTGEVGLFNYLDETAKTLTLSEFEFIMGMGELEVSKRVQEVIDDISSRG